MTPPSPSSTPTILVTGAARRVGAGIARELHAAGARVALHYRHSADAAAALAADFNARRPDSAFTVGADLARFGAAEELASRVLALGGRLDGLVNNASSFFPTPVGSIDRAAWDELIGSNLMGPLFLSQALAPALQASAGAIVNLVDIHAERPLPQYPLYSAAKAGLAGLTRALAVELAPAVRVNGVSPGPIEWPEDGQFSTTERQYIVDHTLLKRIGSATDIARTVRFLLFDAPYITGQIIAVDGGRSAHL
ncbi:pteridine reductase [Thauera aromatica]|uniref:pteridine reductase n=1 Tax=Thauera aromatica TaxID=59405 RepID=UPI001FFD6433|nr:pteridine reductase [Thauera aromatica]MCK2088353.1 pteridine reductase [Thauera aromatica]MCK2126144.1 pteridine reductase [Thauera aromatica]